MEGEDGEEICTSGLERGKRATKRIPTQLQEGWIKHRQTSGVSCLATRRMDGKWTGNSKDLRKRLAINWKETEWICNKNMIRKARQTPSGVMCNTVKQLD